MTKKNIPRKVNRNLFYSKMTLHGFTLASLGLALSPKVGPVRVFEIIYSGKPSYRLVEIAQHLKSTVSSLFPQVKDH